ncbi:MAG: hypothetical protein ACYSW3_02165 [Planctomycetota bacterium]|jgi:hypothetical protein
MRDDPSWHPDIDELKFEQNVDVMEEQRMEAILEQIHKEIDEAGYNPSEYSINDNNGMICFALNYLLSNLDDAFVETVNHDDDEEYCRLTFDEKNEGHPGHPHEYGDS